MTIQEAAFVHPSATLCSGSRGLLSINPPGFLGAAPSPLSDLQYSAAGVPESSWQGSSFLSLSLPSPVAGLSF